MMVSSPTYDPDELVGRERGNNYMKMLYNKRKPLFNRAVKAKYPPGSTFARAGLIGLQEGVLRPSDLHSRHMGYQARRLKMACHAHASPSTRDSPSQPPATPTSATSSATSSTTRNTKTSREGFDVWKEYVESFGFGRKLDSDFLDEGNGYVPTAPTTTASTGVRGTRSRSCRSPSGRMPGLHALAAGQPGVHRRQPRLLLHPAHRQEGRRTGLARRAVSTNATTRWSNRNTSNPSSRACGGA